MDFMRNMYLNALGSTLADEVAKLEEHERPLVLIWMLDRLAEEHGINSMELSRTVHEVFTTLYPAFDNNDLDDVMKLTCFDPDEDYWTE